MDNNIMMLLPLIMGQKNPDMMNMMRSMGGMSGMGGGANPMGAFANLFNGGASANNGAGANGGASADSENNANNANNSAAGNIMSILSAMNQNKGSPDMASMMNMMSNRQNTASKTQNVGHGFMPLEGISTDLINQLMLNLIFTAKLK